MSWAEDRNIPPSEELPEAIRRDVRGYFVSLAREHNAHGDKARVL